MAGKTLSGHKLIIRIVEALRDPKVWAIVLISFTNALPTGGLGAFSNIILTAFVSETFDGRVLLRV